MKANPSIDAALKVWNQLEQKDMRPVMLAMLPGIKTAEILHLPKLDEAITIENIQNLPKYE